MSEPKHVRDTVFKTHDFDVSFWCCECKFNTSGSIYPQKDPLKRFCPICDSILVWCHGCMKYLSAKTVEDLIVCSECNTIILEKNFNEFNPTKKKEENQ